MPTYVFKCPKCGNELERMMSIADYVQTPKPKCCELGCDGHQEMKPQLQGAGISLKGTGWTPKFSNGLADGAPTDILIPKKR